MRPEDFLELEKEQSIEEMEAEIEQLKGQIAVLKAELINAYAQEVQFGQSYIKWRYMSGFDSLDYDAQLKEAVKKAKAELRGDTMLEKVGVTWDA